MSDEGKVDVEVAVKELLAKWGRYVAESDAAFPDFDGGYTTAAEDFVDDLQALLKTFATKENQ